MPRPTTQVRPPRPRGPLHSQEPLLERSSESWKGRCSDIFSRYPGRAKVIGLNPQKGGLDMSEV